MAPPKPRPRMPDRIRSTGWANLFLGIAHMVRYPKSLGHIRHPLAEEAAAKLVHTLGHRYGAEWLGRVVDELPEEPPEIPEPVPDAIPIDPARRSA